MPTLGITARERVVSRISFYLLLIAFSQVSTWIFPDARVQEEQAWIDRGVVPPLIAVPLSDLSYIPENAMRVVR